MSYDYPLFVLTNELRFLLRHKTTRAKAENPTVEAWRVMGRAKAVKRIRATVSAIRMLRSVSNIIDGAV